MKKYINIIILISVALFCISACSSTTTGVKDDQPQDVKETQPETTKGDDKIVNEQEAVALVNGEKILKSDLDAIMKVYSAGAGKVLMNKDQLKGLRIKIMTQMIDAEVILQESKKFPVENLNEKVEQQYAKLVEQAGGEDILNKKIAENGLTIEDVKENISKNITIQSYIENEVVNKIKVTDEELQKDYDANKNVYSPPEQVRASHILIKVEKTATDEQKASAMAKIKSIQERIKLEDFAEVAKGVSECPSSSKGGDLGYFGRGKMVKPFEDVAFSTSIGEVTDIVTTQFGYHIIKVTDKQEASTNSFDDVKEAIKDGIVKSRVQNEMAGIIKRLRAEAEIDLMGN